MERARIEPAIKLILAEIHTKLDEAARIAKAAEACAESGSIAEGVEVFDQKALRKVAFVWD